MDSTADSINHDTLALMRSHDANSIMMEIRKKDVYIEQLRRENEDLHNKIKELSKNTNKKVPQSRYWRKDEHERFLQALEKYGKKDVKSISAYVGTRSPTQVRTHAQKWFLKQKRENERDKKQAKRKTSTSSEDDEGTTVGDDSSDSYNGTSNTNVETTRNIVTRNNKTVEAQPQQYGLSPKLDTKQVYIHTNDDVKMSKKLDLIQKNYLSHLTIEDIAKMLSTYPIAVDPHTNDPQKKYFFPNTVQRISMYHHPTDPSTMNRMMTPPNMIKHDPLIFDSRISTPTLEFHGDSGMLYDGKNHTSMGKDHNDLLGHNVNAHDKDDEDLENELQNLQKNAKRPLTGGLSGYIGHPVGLSPTIFPGSLEYPILSQTPILGDNPLASPFSFGKVANSPLYFVGADHKKM